jgi:hypothetical protein
MTLRSHRRVFHDYLHPGGHRVRGVAEIQANLVQQRVEPVMMFAAERDGKPRDMITPTNMVCFHPSGATADDAFAIFPAGPAHDGFTIDR